MEGSDVERGAWSVEVVGGSRVAGDIGGSRVEGEIEVLGGGASEEG